jgi:hypothetical protein
MNSFSIPCMDSTLVARTTKNTDEQEPDIGSYYAGRKMLLNLVDSLVIFFNLADLESLLSMLAVSCSDNVVVKTCLEAPTSSNNRKSLGVLTTDDRVVPYITHSQTVASITLIWLLLYAAHPDGVIKVIDKRICYRTYKPAASMLGTLDGILPPPVSILEVVVTVCGFCVVPQLLQRVLERAVSTIGGSLQPVAACQHKQCANHSTAGPTSCLSSGASASAKDSAAAVKSDALSVLHSVSHLTAEFAAKSQSHMSDQWNNVGSGTFAVASQRWRYLIEFRLQFDEHDLVTHWTTTMLAAEPEVVK